MRISTSIKAIPLLSSLLIITFLSISNQKEYTRLKILIWDTPSLSLGTYLAISCGTGFIFSYLITSNLARINHSKSKNEMKIPYDSQNKDQNEVFANVVDSSIPISYDRTLIERDLKDASPTINANFRIIGRTDSKNYSPNNYERQDYGISNRSDQPNESEESSYNDEINFKYDNQINNFLNDWDDDSYSQW